MNFFQWPKRLNLPQLLATDEPDAERQAERIRFMERNIGLPVKAVVIAVLFYVLFFSNWFEDMTSVVGLAPTAGSPRAAASSPPEGDRRTTNAPRSLEMRPTKNVDRAFLINKADLISFPMMKAALDTVQRVFLGYVALNIGATCLLLGMSQFALRLVRWVVFTVALVDALFLAAMTMITGGFGSFLFWVFLGLIVRNAVSVPIPALQIMLNLLVSFGYVLAGILYSTISEIDEKMLDPDILAAVQQQGQNAGAEPFILRLFLLLLMTACCYGVQVLVDQQRQAEEEAREFAVRQEQLRSAGRLAAEIAHQIKNPLGIINNAAYTLQRSLREGKGTITQQIQIIREEVERSDKIITELMGYAQLAEGKVERLHVTEELDRAIEQVFPAAAKYDIQIHRQYSPALPQLLIQRNHLNEIFANVLQNAREAMQGRGHIHVTASFADNYSVKVTILDDGPGIPEELRERIFEAYFTTKEKGTGLGLAIVKHNIEMYSGSVKVESELGKGTRFILLFPARTLMKLRK